MFDLRKYTGFTDGFGYLIDAFDSVDSVFPLDTKQSGKRYE